MPSLCAHQSNGCRLLRARWSALVAVARKRGKEHEVPVHSKAREAIDLWLEASGLGSHSAAPLFPAFGNDRETIELKRLDRRSILKLVEKLASASGIIKRVCSHSFPATGITEYMNSGGIIEIAQQIAGHKSSSTTRIYDRSRDRLTIEEIERVKIGLAGGANSCIHGQK